MHSGTRARQARSLRSRRIASWRYLYPILYEAGTHFIQCPTHACARRRPAIPFRAAVAAARNTRAGVRTAPPMEVPAHDHRASSGHHLHAAYCSLCPYLIVERPLLHVQTRRDHGHAMRVRTSSPEFTEALGAAAFGIDGQRLIKITERGDANQSARCARAVRPFRR